MTEQLVAKTQGKNWQASNSSHTRSVDGDDLTFSYMPAVHCGDICMHDVMPVRFWNVFGAHNVHGPLPVFALTVPILQGEQTRSDDNVAGVDSY